MAVFCCACLDEFHQLFVRGREGKFTDVLIDTAGALLGIVIVQAVIFAFYKIKKIQNSTKMKKLGNKKKRQKILKTNK